MGEFMVEMEVGDMEGKRYVPFTGVSGHKRYLDRIADVAAGIAGRRGEAHGPLQRRRRDCHGAPRWIYLVALQWQGCESAGGLCR